MAVYNKNDAYQFEAGEDLSACQYHAVSLGDGQLATNGEEATGILVNKPADGEYGTLVPSGVVKFRAGEGLTLGGKLTVSASGWITAGDSGDYIVGEAFASCDSGSIGTGYFSFPTAAYLPV